MESVSFPTSDVGVEEMDRALMDLGPLLGVSIKEEVSEESADVLPGAAPVPTSNVEGLPGPLEAKVEHPGAEGEGADSLAPPGARCVLCRQPLALADGVPKLMECLHSACEPCLKAKIDEKMANNMQRDFLGAERITITCPVCRLQCGAANMIEQRFVMEKMESASASAVMDDQRCSSCDDTEPATSYCVDCADFICDSCVTAHQRLKITKDHTIKCKEEAAAELQAASGPRTPHDMFCREHPQERLSLFCETCDRLTCRDCQLQHHRDHKYQFSTEMAAQARASIAALVSEVSYKRVLLGSAMKVIRERQLLIADKKKALVHEITQAVVKLTNAINTRGKQLVLRLNEVCDAKQRTLTEKKEALEQLAGITDHCVEFVSAALRSGSDTAVLHSKRTVQAHLQRIKSRRADIPNPEIPVRISLALDKMPDLIRVVSSIGAIVVDGKVDGGAGAAQGPYHPPQQPQQQQQQQQQPPPQQQQQQQQQQQPLAQAHSAVVALQHAAMHQSFVQGGAGAWPRRLGPLGPLPHGPLRHPHVTSTTHPHHLHGMNEINLRGLLNAGGARALPPRHLPPAHAQAQAMHHAYQQMMGGYQVSGAGRRSATLPRTPSPAPAPPAPAPALARWHTPHLSPHNGGYEAGASTGTTDFKITLGRQHSGGSAPSTPRAALVSSTNPKTPSPSLSLNGSMGGGSGQLGAGALELDKVCAESVQDLMATIAKLDSNGVQVVAEAPSPAPLVHSSTAGAGAGAGADPNEDWCAVCMDGGELMCCDKCPKVFHQYCHIPTIEKVPDETETWQCLLCVNFANLPPEEDGSGALTARAQKLVERITLELYCQYELSLAFREPVPASNHHYHSKISRPMCLDWIRMKLQPGSEERYTHVAQFLQDCRLLFNNAYRYNPPESQIYKDAKRLEEFLDAQLVKWLPEYAYWSGEGPPPNKRPRLD